MKITTEEHGVLIQSLLSSSVSPWLNSFLLEKVPGTVLKNGVRYRFEKRAKGKK
jgi:hypothetical protein